MLRQLTAQELTDLMIRDLERSGLKPSDGFFEPGTYQGRQGYFLFYPHPETGTPTDFFRFRFLDKPKGVAAFTKQQRYTQAAGVTPRAYFSTLCKWPAILADPTQRLLITEGEKKAAAACKHGLPCIGLGGVWNFKVKDTDQLIPDLQKIAWQGRKVFIILDSDAYGNRQVQKGAQVLSELLKRSGGAA